MLIDFLQLCRPVLQCESEDFAQCLIDIQQQEKMESVGHFGQLIFTEWE